MYGPWFETFAILSVLPRLWYVTDALRDKPSNAKEWDSIVTTIKKKVIFMKNQIGAFNFVLFKDSFLNVLIYF